MRIISHRGNLSGPNPDRENTIEYICEALNHGFDVEVDVWDVGINIPAFFLGHDHPKIPVSKEFLKNEHLWCHAKNFMALHRMMDFGIHCFAHQNDDRVLTSKGYVWTFPGKEILYTFSNSITVAVLPETVNDWIDGQSPLYGICTDYAHKYKQGNFKNKIAFEKTLTDIKY